jgi:hypothetical protein
MTEIPDSTVVGEFGKGANESIIGYLSEYKGSRIAHVRILENGRLTKKGVTVRFDQLPNLLKLIEGLCDAAETPGVAVFA